MRAFLLMVTLSLVTACGPGDKTFGVAQPATGHVTMNSPSSGGTQLTGFVFDNQGTQSVLIDQPSVTLTSGQIMPLMAGFGVSPNIPITFSFNVQNHETQPSNVAALSFDVQGTTERLVVEITTDMESIPGAPGPAGP
jgi:hypothetical protein